MIKGNDQNVACFNVRITARFNVDHYADFYENSYLWEYNLKIEFKNINLKI